MKGTIGFLFFLLFLACFALVSLQSRQTLPETASGGTGPLTGPDWRPVRLFGNSVPPELDLLANFSVDGRLKGNAGCNHYSGRYERDGSGFRVEAMRATRRGCNERLMAIEKSLFDVYRAAREVSFSGAELRFHDAEGTWLATFEPAPQDARPVVPGS